MVFLFFIYKILLFIFVYFFIKILFYKNHTLSMRINRIPHYKLSTIRILFDTFYVKSINKDELFIISVLISLVYFIPINQVENIIFYSNYKTKYAALIIVSLLFLVENLQNSLGRRNRFCMRTLVNKEFIEAGLFSNILLFINFSIISITTNDNSFSSFNLFNGNISLSYLVILLTVLIKFDLMKFKVFSFSGGQFNERQFNMEKVSFSGFVIYLMILSSLLLNYINLSKTTVGFGLSVNAILALNFISFFVILFAFVTLFYWLNFIFMRSRVEFSRAPFSHFLILVSIFNFLSMVVL